MGNFCGTPLTDDGGGVLQLGATPHKQQKNQISGVPTPTAVSAPSQRAQSLPSPKPQPEKAPSNGGERRMQSAFDQACSGSKLEALAVEYLSKELGDGHAVFGEDEGGGENGKEGKGEGEVEEVRDEEEERTVRWQQGELIGAGAFGRVYLGLNLDTGQLMAVKQVSIARDLDAQGRVAEHVRNLEAEVHVLKQLHHPNIVRYLGTERCMAAMSLNIFLEFVPGGSIASLLAKFGSFTESVIRVYTKQILLGLEFLHTHQIMHRDIKGANILVDNSGVVKLADFGASKKIEDLVTVDSGFKSIKGTPYWMAPEVITQTGHGRQADIWSVGCTVIEMATGKPPWIQNFPVPMSAMFHIASSKHPPPLPEHLSPEAKDFLLLCFNRVPKERPNATRLLQHPFLSSSISTSVAVPSKLPTTSPPPVPALRPVTPPPDVSPPPVAPVPGSGFRYIPPHKPLSPVAEINSAGMGSLGPSPLGRKPGEATGNGKPGLPPVRKASGRQGGRPEDVGAFKSSMSANDPLNESVALTVDSMMSSISYNPVEEPSWLQSIASSSSMGLPPPQPIYFGKENCGPRLSEASIPSEKNLTPLEHSEEPEQLPGDEEKIMEYVREKAFRETSRLSTPFLEHKVNSPSPTQQGAPGGHGPQVLSLDGPSPTPLPPRPRMGRPVRPKTDNERMSKSRQWEAELERELEAERMKSKTPRSHRTPRDSSMR